MLPIINIDDHEINVKNVNQFNIDWSKLLDNIRKKTGYRLHEIASYAGVTHTRLQKASGCQSCRFSNCEQISLLDLYQDNCKDMNHFGVFK